MMFAPSQPKFCVATHTPVDRVIWYPQRRCGSELFDGFPGHVGWKRFAVIVCTSNGIWQRTLKSQSLKTHSRICVKFNELTISSIRSLSALLCVQTCLIKANLVVCNSFLSASSLIYEKKKNILNEYLIKNKNKAFFYLMFDDDLL